MRAFNKLPLFWRLALIRITILTPMGILIGWLVIGGWLGALLGLPMSVVVGFVAHLHVWRTEGPA